MDEDFEVINESVEKPQYDDEFEMIDEVTETSKSHLSSESGVSMKTWLTQKLILTMEKYSSASKKSNINKTGQLTPDEFVETGDYLVSNFPSWQWQSGEKSKIKSQLPEDKQYLVIRQVACIPQKELNVTNVDNYVTIDSPTVTEYDELEDLESIDDLPEDESVYYNKDLCVKTRRYDIYITYDSYYSTPRVWLYGYNENGQPLEGAEWQQDFSNEHVSQTVTFESYPHESFSCPTIHPCRHAKTMLKMFNLMGKHDNSVYIKNYLIIFLKFIQTMVPNMEYDFTTGVNV